MATLKVGTHEPGRLNHLLDVPGGIGVAHRSFRDGRSTCTGFSVIVPAPEVGARCAAGLHALNGAGELTGSHQIREWGLFETPILLTNTPSVGRGYDAVSAWMMERDPAIGRDKSVVIPVVGECDDSVLHDPRIAAWGQTDAFAALEEALAIARGREAPPAALAQGSVGAGTGTIAFDLKAGIGSASRVVPVGRNRYTLGVLLQTNFGSRPQLMIQGEAIGKKLDLPLPEQHREGSCIGILATDAPLDPLGLSRLAQRMGLGLARAGSHAHHGSGEIFLAFSTAGESRMEPRWDTAEWNGLLQAAVEAAEEAVYQSLLHAEPVRNARAEVTALS